MPERPFKSTRWRGCRQYKFKLVTACLHKRLRRCPLEDGKQPYGFSSLVSSMVGKGSFYLKLLCPSLRYNRQISALNQIQAVLTCEDVGKKLFPLETLALPSCIPMSSFKFSVVTAIFTSMDL